MPHRTLSPIWPTLPFHLRLRIYLTVLYHHHILIFRYLTRSLIWTIILLIVLPPNPLILPTAVGGGLSFGMLIFPEK